MTEEIKRLYHNNGNIRTETHFLNRKLHRENYPAIISYYQNGNIMGETYFLNGKCHRDNGPSVIWYYPNGNVEHKLNYLNDIDITNEIENLSNIISDKSILNEDIKLLYKLAYNKDILDQIINLFKNSN